MECIEFCQFDGQIEVQWCRSGFRGEGIVMKTIVTANFFCQGRDVT